MELKKAIERLLEIRDRHSKNVKMLEESKVYVKNTAFEDVLIERKKDIEVIDTVLAELDKQKEEIENYKNTIEVIEDLGRKKISEILEKAESRTMTNGDKIRQMNNEELAKLMSHECMCCMQGEYCETSCKEGIKAFLDEEAEIMPNEVIRRINNERL